MKHNRDAVSGDRLQTPVVGQVFWVTGLAGAGKSSIAEELCVLIRGIKPNVVSLDGDVMREVFGATASYSPAERLALAFQYGRLCRLLADQGIDVVCATISMFHEVRAWNREHIAGYREIYVRVPIEVLIARDQKQLYSQALRGERLNVAGIDLVIEEPVTPDVVLDNGGQRPPADLAREVFIQYYPVSHSRTSPSLP